MSDDQIQTDDRVAFENVIEAFSLGTEEEAIACITKYREQVVAEAEQNAQNKIEAVASALLTDRALLSKCAEVLKWTKDVSKTCKCQVNDLVATCDDLVAEIECKTDETEPEKGASCLCDDDACTPKRQKAWGCKQKDGMM